MCLASVFVTDWSGPPILDEVAHMEVYEDRVELETLMGERKTVPGRVVAIDFMKSGVLLGQQTTHGKRDDTAHYHAE
jgi:predicted RNA-binding protein